MSDGTIIGSLDLTTLLFSAFVLFFIGLVFYLRREDRREGYPLESDTTGKMEPTGSAWYPTAKEMRLPTGDIALKPDTRREPISDKMKRLALAV